MLPWYSNESLFTSNLFVWCFFGCSGRTFPWPGLSMISDGQWPRNCASRCLRDSKSVRRAETWRRLMCLGYLYLYIVSWRGPVTNTMGRGCLLQKSFGASLTGVLYKEGSAKRQVFLAGRTWFGFVSYVYACILWGIVEMLGFPNRDRASSRC